MAVHWTLIELNHRLGIQYSLSLVDFRTRAQKSPEYLAINPKGQVPCLIVKDGDAEPYAITECVAILLFLSERHPEAGLAPVNGKDRAFFLETMVFIANTLLPFIPIYMHSSEDERSGSLGVADLKRIEDGFQWLDDQLKIRGNEYIATKDQVSVADFMCITLARWTRGFPRPALAWGNIRSWAERVTSLDSWKTLYETEYRIFKTVAVWELDPLLTELEE